MKIVSLLPSATEIVCALGLEDQLVGITHECDFPASIADRPALTASRISHESMSSKEIDHAVRSQLDGHGSIYDLDNKMLDSIKPDLILTQELCDVCAVNYDMVMKAAKIYAAEAKVISLEPNTIEDIFDNIKAVGDLTDSSERSIRLVNDLQERLDNVRSKIPTSQKPTIFMLEWLEPPFAPGHWVPEQVEIAGGFCLLGEAGKPSVTTTFEAIYDAQPDIIVLIPCGYYIYDTLRQLEFTKFPSNWREIPAIKKGEVWATDASSYFSRPAPRVVNGVEILSKIFHSGLFGKPDESEAVRVPPNLLKFA